MNLSCQPASESDGTADCHPAETSAAVQDLPDRSRSGVVFARLFVGLIVLVCAEVFSGASVQVGLWAPWTWLVTYWLYFAHFFFFTTLAVRTGRTSLGALYLWGVLFGLYEFWITKVIWHGYGGDGTFALGNLGPYGYSEISMAFFFHPVASFILPLTMTCLLCPPLRRLFPDLAWLTGRTRWARLVQVYLVVAFCSVLAMNSGGPVHLVANLAFILVLLLLFWRLARSTFSSSDGRDIVAFRRRGFVGLCVYLLLLYGVTYPFLRPDGLPSISLQLFTFVFYALAVAGIWMYYPREPLPDGACQVEGQELRLVKVLFASLLAVAVALSPLAGTHVIAVPAVVNLAIWPLLGFLLTGLALASGVRERIGNMRADGNGHRLAADASSHTSDAVSDAEA